MRNWDTRDESGTDQGCEWEKDWEDVQQVCKQLDIPCEMVLKPLLLCAPSHTQNADRPVARVLEQSL